MESDSTSVLRQCGMVLRQAGRRHYCAAAALPSLGRDGHMHLFYLLSLIGVKPDRKWKVG